MLLGSRAGGGGSNAPPLGFLNLAVVAEAKLAGPDRAVRDASASLQGGRWGPVPSANENVQSPGLLPPGLVMCLRVQSENLF